MTKSVFVLAIATLTLGAAAPVWADVPYTFTFSDEYYVSSLTEFRTLFGSSTAGYSGTGIYQETNTTTPIVTKLGDGSDIPGEYEQNTTPNASKELVIDGWDQSLTNGQQVANVYNVANPQDGPVLFFQYKVNGTITPFTFDSFNLKGSSPSADLSFTLEGFRNGTMVDSAKLTVTGDTFTLFTEDWANVDTVEFVSTGSLPLDWCPETLYMDNISINTPVPEPAGAALLSTMLIALGVFMRKRIRVS